MNKEAIKKWLAALRSGNYKKCDGYMRSGDKFCAYGVLCDLHATQFNNEWCSHSYLGRTYLPPQAIWDWLGKDSYEILQVTSSSVDRINDSSATLSKAADTIEYKIKKSIPNFFEVE